MAIEKQNIQQELGDLTGPRPDYPILNAIPFVERQQIFDKIKAENIEYRYINGSCEDRSHYITLLLGSLGVDSGKIWNFAPARYTFLSTELFYIYDPLNINDVVNWGYHVSPYIRSFTESGEIETLIIDQSFFSEGFLTLDQWLSKMNCPRSIYLLTSSNYYNFYAINSVNVDSVTASPGTILNVPVVLPSIVTGSFWKLYEMDDNVEKGLSINDLAMKIYYSMANYLPYEQDFLKYILRNIEGLINLTINPCPYELQVSSHQQLLSYYQSRYQYWQQKRIALVS